MELESEKYLIQVEEEIGASETNSAQNSQAVSSTTDPGKPVEVTMSMLKLLAHLVRIGGESVE